MLILESSVGSAKCIIVKMNCVHKLFPPLGFFLSFFFFQISMSFSLLNSTSVSTEG